ncbi:MAG TPA: efflux RND transporter periplasmic adaptor subunit, partial [Gemmataceae bacterium]|nr:efflux RND transporter periplasmic adaptor subunit [Gemmataceae bacterium]
MSTARRLPALPVRASGRMLWKWIELFAVVLGSLAAAGFWFWPGRGDADEVRLPGTVEAQEVQLGSRVGGRVAAVHVQEGQLVEPGQVLVTFEAQELSARRDQAQGRLAAAQAALERAIHGPLPEEIAEAQAAADAARARLERTRAGAREEHKRQAQGELGAVLAEQRQADEDFARAERLVSVAAVSRAEYDAALAVRDRARHRVRVTQAARDLLLHGSRPEEIAEAQADFERVQAHCKLLRRGTRDEDRAAAAAAVAQARAQLAEAEATLRETVVTATERCVVEGVTVRPGSVLAAGQPVIVAHRAADLWVKVFVPAPDLGRLRLGQEVAVTVASHPGQRFVGTVAQIATVSESTPRNGPSLDERRQQVFAVKVRVTDPEGGFKPGMAAEVFVTRAEV